MTRARQVTVRDVAREANVSVASVSRALNGLATITPETRDRVRAVADRLGYVPHAGARSLSLARTRVIGVVLPDLHGEFFSELVRSLDRATAARGYHMLFSTMHADPELARQAMRAMHGRVDGLIMMAPQLAPERLAELLPRATPALLVNSPPLAGHDQVSVDNRAGVDLLFSHLVAAGARRVVHVTGPSGNRDADERLAAFHAGLAAHAAAVSAVLVPGDFTDGAGEAGVARLLAAGEAFDAVLAANDAMALGALSALRAAGRRVPDEVVVAGFDDVPIARHFDLTTVRVPLEPLGEAAVGRLIDRCEGRGAEPVHHRFVPELVARGSTRRS